MKQYIPVPTETPLSLGPRFSDPATHVKVSTNYEKGGMNLFTYKESRRGYYLHVQAVDRSGDGFERMVLMGNGFKFLLREAKRFNAAQLEKVNTIVQPKVEALIKVWLVNKGTETGELVAMLEQLKEETTK